MRKKTLLVVTLAVTAALLYGQSAAITDTNTITINGTVYHYRPAITPSSPQPTVGGGGFIGAGSWYGADAAKTWASIADWVMEHCIDSTSPVKAGNGAKVYISQIHAYRGSTAEAKKHAAPGGFSEFDGITVYYWIVPRGAQMEDGRVTTRRFKF